MANETYQFNPLITRTPEGSVQLNKDAAVAEFQLRLQEKASADALALAQQAMQAKERIAAQRNEVEMQQQAAALAAAQAQQQEAANYAAEVQRRAAEITQQAQQAQQQQTQNDQSQKELFGNTTGDNLDWGTLRNQLRIDDMAEGDRYNTIKKAMDVFAKTYGHDQATADDLTKQLWEKEQAKLSDSRGWFEPNLQASNEWGANNNANYTAAWNKAASGNILGGLNDAVGATERAVIGLAPAVVGSISPRAGELLNNLGAATASTVQTLYAAGASALRNPETDLKYAAYLDSIINAPDAQSRAALLKPSAEHSLTAVTDLQGLTNDQLAQRRDQALANAKTNAAKNANDFAYAQNINTYGNLDGSAARETANHKLDRLNNQYDLTAKIKSDDSGFVRGLKTASTMPLDLITQMAPAMVATVGATAVGGPLAGMAVGSTLGWSQMKSEAMSTRDETIRASKKWNNYLAAARGDETFALQLAREDAARDPTAQAAAVALGALDGVSGIEKTIGTIARVGKAADEAKKVITTVDRLKTAAINIGSEATMEGAQQVATNLAIQTAAPQQYILSGTGEAVGTAVGLTGAVESYGQLHGIVTGASDSAAKFARDKISAAEAKFKGTTDTSQTAGVTPTPDPANPPEFSNGMTKIEVLRDINPLYTAASVTPTQAKAMGANIPAFSSAADNIDLMSIYDNYNREIPDLVQAHAEAGTPELKAQIKQDIDSRKKFMDSMDRVQTAAITKMASSDIGLAKLKTFLELNDMYPDKMGEFVGRLNVDKAKTVAAEAMTALASVGRADVIGRYATDSKFTGAMMQAAGHDPATPIMPFTVKSKVTPAADLTQQVADQAQAKAEADAKAAADAAQNQQQAEKLRADTAAIRTSLAAQSTVDNGGAAAPATQTFASLVGKRVVMGKFNGVVEQDAGGFKLTNGATMVRIANTAPPTTNPMGTVIHHPVTPASMGVVAQTSHTGSTAPYSARTMNGPVPPASPAPQGVNFSDKAVSAINSKFIPQPMNETAAVVAANTASGIPLTDGQRAALSTLFQQTELSLENAVAAAKLWLGDAMGIEFVNKLRADNPHADEVDLTRTVLRTIKRDVLMNEALEDLTSSAQFALDKMHEAPYTEFNVLREQHTFTNEPSKAAAKLAAMDWVEMQAALRKHAGQIDMPFNTQTIEASPEMIDQHINQDALDAALKVTHDAKLAYDEAVITLTQQQSLPENTKGLRGKQGEAQRKADAAKKVYDKAVATQPERIAKVRAVAAAEAKKTALKNTNELNKSIPEKAISHVMDAVLGNAQVARVVLEDTRKYAGRYDPATKTIYISKYAKDPMDVLMHEVLHSATVFALGKDGKAAQNIAAILNHPQVTAVMSAYLPDASMHPDTYTAEALTVLFGSQGRDARLALDAIKVDNNIATTKTIWGKVVDFLMNAFGISNKDKQVSALRSLYLNTVTLTAQNSPTKAQLNTQFYAQAAVDYYTFKYKTGSYNLYDGVLHFDQASQTWFANYVDANGAPVTTPVLDSADGMDLMINNGMELHGRGHGVQYGQPTIAIPSAVRDLNLLGASVYGVTRFTTNLLKLGKDPKTAHDMALRYALTFSHTLSALLVKYADNMRMLNLLDPTGQLRRDATDLRNATAADLSRQGYYQTSVHDSITGFANYLSNHGITHKEIGQFAYAMSVDGAMRRIAANRGTDPEIAAMFTGGTGFEFTDANGVTHTSDGKNDRQIAALYLAQLTPQKRQAMGEAMDSLYKANQRMHDIYLGMGIITPEEHMELTNDPYYAPLRDAELHKLLTGERQQGRSSKADNPAQMLIAVIEAKRRYIGRVQEDRLLVEHLRQNPSSHFRLDVQNVKVSGGKMVWSRAKNNGDKGEQLYVPMSDGTEFIVSGVTPQASAYIRGFRRMHDVMTSNAPFDRTLRYIGTGTAWVSASLTTFSIPFMLKALSWDVFSAILNVQGALGKDPVTGKHVIATADAPKVLMLMVKHLLGAQLASTVHATGVNNGGKAANTVKALTGGVSMRFDTAHYRLYQGNGGGINSLHAIGFDQAGKNLHPDFSGSILNKVGAAGTVLKDTAHTTAEVAHSFGDGIRYTYFLSTLEHMTGVDITKLNETQLAAFAQQHDSAIKMAARGSNDITTDFNIRSAYPGPRMLYSFFQAAMTATTRTLPQIMTSPFGAILMGIIATAALSSAGADDQAQGNDADGTPKYLRQKRATAGLYFGQKYGMQLPPETEMAVEFGRAIYAISKGHISIGDAIFGSEKFTGLMKTGLRMASPLRNLDEGPITAKSILTMFVPSVLEPVRMAAFGTDRFGTPILNERAYSNGSFTTPGYNYQLATQRDSQLAKSLSKAAARWAHMDVAPAYIDSVGSTTLGRYYKDAIALREGTKTVQDIVFSGYETGYDKFAIKQELENKAVSMAKASEHAKLSGKPDPMLEAQIKSLDTARASASRLRIDGVSQSKIYTELDAAKLRGDTAAVDKYNQMLDTLRNKRTNADFGMLRMLDGNN